MIAETTVFQEFTFIVKYCPFISIFGVRSLSWISYKRKKGFTGIPNIYVSEKMHSKQFSYVNITRKNDLYLDCWPCAKLI